MGADLGSWSFAVEAGKIAEFARAVGAEPSHIAPPTFTVVAAAQMVERLVVEVLGLDRARTVHGEQHYEYLAPVRAGMMLLCTARLTGETRKPGRRGGQMRLLSVEVTYADAATGATLVRETMTTIEKEA